MHNILMLLICSKYITVKWPSWHLELSVNQVFVQLFVQTNNKETSKVHITGPLWGESTGDQWIQLTMCQ